MLPTMKSAIRWQSELLIEAGKFEQLKKNIDLNESFESFQDIAEYAEKDADRATGNTEIDEQEEEQEGVAFSFKFDAPRIQLQLITEEVRRWT